ncbi:DEAD/DEAH box helicase [Effusibacillus pohliae]|uniref:DEAD/DEAH box helicase n=1 Tax=Effusibacillus pohliae TaxID=232270 RepID=UPI00037D797A|nr:DEAD/DEAH box helicase [Effusibacillus pohliae]
MIAQETLAIHCNRLQSGDFFVWGTGGNDRSVSPHSFKTQLFAWHYRSYYGTTLEEAQSDGKWGLVLDPLMALDFFASPAPSLYAKFSWSSETLLLQRAAQIYRTALANGWFAPSFESWQAGRFGWKLLLPPELEASYQPLLQDAERQGVSYLHEWFEAVLAEMLQQEPEVAAAWEKLQQEHKLLQSAAEPGQSKPEQACLDEEEEWLIAIGWKRDSVPFRTCIQLVEPEGEDDSWQLRLILQGKADPNQLVEADFQGTTLAGELPPEWQESAGDRIAKDTARWVRIVPWLQSDDSAAGIRTELSDEEAWEFLNESCLRLMQAGYSVFLPAWWEELRRLKPRLKAKIQPSVGAAGNSLFGLDQLVEFDWKLAVGDMDLSEAEFLRLAEEKKRLLRIRGRWIQLDPAFLSQVQQTIKRVQKKQGLSLREVLELHLLGSGEPASAHPDGQGGTEGESGEQDQLRLEVELNSHLKKFMKQLQRQSVAPLVQPPAELNAKLRTYQLEGVSWLLFLRQFGLGGCLADDMGLGKTIQFISYLLHARKETCTGPALLICPTSVLGNWQKELQRFAPSLRVYLHYGSQRAKGEAFAETVQDVDLVISSYALAHLDQDELRSVRWDCICLDEAQNIKNPHTKQAAAIRKLEGVHRIALTGTPIENRLTELWSIFDFLNPGYLGSLRSFTEKYVAPIEKKNDPLLISQVQKLIRPFLLRRVKKDPAIQLALPEKNEAKTYVSLTPEQAALYENVVQDLFRKIDSLTGMEKRGLILGTLTKLKQICDHPALFLKERSPAWKRRSNKIARLLEMIHELREEGDKCLIFTQFVEMGQLLQAILEKERREPVQFLHGGVTKTARDQMVARFQDDSLPAEKQCGIFILSLRAGGTGLNLTAANHVFHFDRWWNPAVEDQATDRAFRIGQTKDVQVHKFVTLGTLEERIDEMIERKQGLSRQIVGTGENWITEMSTDELRELFALRKEWIGK